MCVRVCVSGGGGSGRRGGRHGPNQTPGLEQALPAHETVNTADGGEWGGRISCYIQPHLSESTRWPKKKKVSHSVSVPNETVENFLLPFRDSLTRNKIHM